jgi:hypothetical protein
MEEARLDRPQREPHRVSHFALREPLVVVQDDHRSLVTREAPESALERVLRHERLTRVFDHRLMEGKQGDLRSASSLTAAFVATGVGQ